jgi:hypothetical protein
MTVPSVRDTHNAWIATLTDDDLRAGDDLLIDPARSEWGAVSGKYNGWHVSFPLDGIERPVYDAEDTTARQIHDNDPETT